MHSEQFIKAIENYYGKYKSGVKAVVVQYLTTVPENELPEIRRQLHLTVSTQYGHVPDVATIEQARKEIGSTRPALPEYKPLLPEPDARSMKIEAGELMKKIMMKVRR